MKLPISRAEVGKFAIRLWSRIRRQARVAGQYAAILAKNLSRYQRVMRLDRPIGIWLLLWPTLWALWVAADGQPSQAVFAVFVLGTIIARSAGCIVNDLVDRKLDAEVRRTSDRPLATGEMEPAEAVFLFIGLMLIALGLVVTMNGLTVLLAVAGAGVTLIYPYMKRLIAAPQLVLGLAFAWGVPMAYAAQTGAVPRVGWLLYLTALIWVVIYDTQYAMADRDDDLKLGIKSTAILFGEMDRMILACLQLLLLSALVLTGRGAEMGVWYYVGLGAAAMFGLRQQYLIREREPDACFQAFQNNSWFGAAVFVGIALDYLFRG